MLTLCSLAEVWALVPACINQAGWGRDILGEHLALIFNETGQLALPSPASRPITQCCALKKTFSCRCKKVVGVAAAVHTDPALDTLEWLLGAAGNGAAIWRRSAAPPGADAVDAGAR